jgi:hypothetical protein
MLVVVVVVERLKGLLVEVFFGVVKLASSKD